MESLKGINKTFKFKVTALCVSLTAILTLLSGCSKWQWEELNDNTSGVFADKFRPDVNSIGQLLLDPTKVHVSFDEAPNEVYSEDSNITLGSLIGEDDGTVYNRTGPLTAARTTDGSERVDTDTNAAGISYANRGGESATTRSEGRSSSVVGSALLPCDLVAGREYTAYLDEEIYTQLRDLLEDKKVYFRVFSMTPNGERKNVSVTFGSNLEGYALTTNSVINKASSTRYAEKFSFDATLLSDFTIKYLGDSPKNKEAIRIAWNREMSNLNQFKSYLEANSINPANVFSSSVYLEHCDKTTAANWIGNFGEMSFTQYYSIVQNAYNFTTKENMAAVLPNIQLNYYATTNNDNSTVAINQCSTVTDRINTYYTWMYRSQVDKVFTAVSQFPSGRLYNGANELVYSNTSGDEILHAYVNGYNTTIIYVAYAGSGSTMSNPTRLKDELGEELYNQVLNLVNSAKMPNETGSFTEVIPAGSRGVGY